MRWLLPLAVLALASPARAVEQDSEEEPAPMTETGIALVPEQIMFAAPGGETLVRIEVLGPGPPAASLPRLSTTAGRIEDLRRTGERSFEARFFAGETRFPQMAIIGAETDEPHARGFVSVALCAPAQPAFRSKPGAKITVTVGGRSFGPVSVGEEGEVRVPIVVPPGVATAHVRVADPAGLVTEKDIALHPPPFPRLMLLAPSVLPAGAVVEVGLVGIEADGQPVDESRLVLRSGYQRPHPLGARERIARYLIRVPPRLESGPLRLTALLRPGTGRGLAEGSQGLEDREDVDTLAVYLPVVAGPLAQLELTQKRSRLVLEGADLWGHRVPVDGVEIFVDGHPARLERTPDGDAVVAAAAGTARAPVEVEAMLHGIYTHYRFGPAGTTLPAPPPARPEPPVHGTMLAALGALLPAGPGYGVAARVDVESARSPLPPSFRPGLGVAYLGMRTEAGDEIARSTVTLDELLVLARLRFRHGFAGGVDVSAAAGAGLGVSHLRTHIGTVALASNDFDLATELAAEVAAPAGPGAVSLGVRYLRVGLGSMAGGDTVDGSGGGLVFDLGYRVGF